MIKKLMKQLGYTDVGQISGVSFDKRKKVTLTRPWKSYLYKDGMRVDLGHHTTRDEALVTRLKAEKFVKSSKLQGLELKQGIIDHVRG